MTTNRNCHNTFDDFNDYCQQRGIVLNDGQKAVARELFSMPICSGKSVLITLLYKYDPSAEFYLRFGRVLSCL